MRARGRPTAKARLPALAGASANRSLPVDSTYPSFFAVGLWVRSVYGGQPYNFRMKHDARFEVRLTADTRRELEELAATCGLTSADLARLGIKWLLRRGLEVGPLVREGVQARVAMPEGVNRGS
jgi:hypothetical protein